MNSVHPPTLTRKLQQTRDAIKSAAIPQNMMVHDRHTLRTSYWAELPDGSTFSVGWYSLQGSEPPQYGSYGDSTALRS